MLGRRSSLRRLCEFPWVIQPWLGFLVFVSFLFVDEARRAAETAERQANFDAASHAHHNTYS